MFIIIGDHLSLNSSAWPFAQSGQNSRSLRHWRGGTPLCISKQEAGTYSHLDGEYVDPWSAVISMSSLHQ
jgi:hypothetical protein